MNSKWKKEKSPHHEKIYPYQLFSFLFEKMLHYSLVFGSRVLCVLIYDIENFCLLRVFIGWVSYFHHCDSQSSKQDQKLQPKSSRKRQWSSKFWQISNHIEHWYIDREEHPQKQKVQNWLRLSKTKTLYHKNFDWGIHISSIECRQSKKHNQERLEKCRRPNPKRWSISFHRNDLQNWEEKHRYTQSKQN